MKVQIELCRPSAIFSKKPFLITIFVLLNTSETSSIANFPVGGFHIASVRHTVLEYSNITMSVYLSVGHI